MKDRSGAHRRSRDTRGLSDDELVQRARESDSAAYGELWLRHSAAAHAAARSFSSLDPDDLVAEAFARILAAIGRGGGPQMGFRPYLLTSVRNVAAEWGARQQRVDTTDLEDAEAAASPPAEHEALSALENGAAATAFRSLPTRWQEALWYSDVDGLKPRQFAPLLGLAPNAASALVVRARRGFRDAWIQTQLRAADSEQCQDVIALLGSHTRHALSRRDSRAVDDHLETCDGCAIAWAEARDVASRLALVLLPITVGVSAATAYAAWVQAGGSQAVPVASAGGARGDLRSTTRSVSTTVRSGRAVVATVGVLGVLALGGVAAAALSTSAITATVSDAAGPLAAAPTHGSPPTPSAGTASPPSSDAYPSRPPEHRPGTDDVDSSTPTAAPRTALPSAAPAPTHPDAPAPAPADQPPGPEPPEPEPEPPSEPPALAAPTMTVDTSAGERVYPLLFGDDAHPGAQIEIIDESGVVRAQTTADDAGRWHQAHLSGGDCTTDATPYLAAGVHHLAVRQTVDGLQSAPGPSTPITILEPPRIDSPGDGDTVDANGFVLTVHGTPGASVQRIKVPDASPCRPDPMTLDSDGLLSQQFTALDRGAFTVGIRYIDPASGRHGPAVFATLTAF